MKSIEKIIINLLQKKSLKTTKIIKKCQEERSGTTKQGVYRVLKKLKAEEKIVEQGKIISLNLFWIKKMNDFFSLAHHRYSPKEGYFNDFINLKEKERITYTFQSLKLLDVFLTHALYLFSEILEKKAPIFIFNPHEWFFYARQETENFLITTLKKQRRQFFIVSNHDTPLDKNIKKEFSNDWMQYHIEKNFILSKKNYYLNLFGDFIIEIWLDGKTNQKLESFFQKYFTFNKTAQKEISKIILEKGKNKVVISKNKNRAAKLKKKFTKFFYVKNN